MSRIGPGTMMAVIFAILIGLGGAYTVRQLLQETPPTEKKVVVQTRVVPTVAYDLPEGRVIALTDIIPRRMTEDEFKRSKYATVGEFMSSVQQLVGRRLKKSIPKGNTIAVTDLWPDGLGPDIEKMLKPGHLAKPLPIAENDPVLSYIAPGSKVDVYFRTRPIEPTAENTNRVPSRTVTLLESVEVLDVEKVAVPQRQFGRTSLERRTTPSNRAPEMRVRKVTVMVTEYQAKALAMIEGQGELRLALRNRNDFSTASPASSEKQMTIGQLLGLPVGVRQSGMTVYRGGAQQNIIFEQKPVFDESLKIRTPVPAEPPKTKPKAALGS